MKAPTAKPNLRCAIYTRVSTDARLEQEFNSLDAQLEASEAYIKSQTHEGWSLVRTRYDDGGCSGRSMELLVVVLNDWVTETKETRWTSNSSTSLAKSVKRSGQAIDLIDDDHVNPFGLHLQQELLQRGACNAALTSRSNWAKDNSTFRVSLPMHEYDRMVTVLSSHGCGQAKDKFRFRPLHCQKTALFAVKSRLACCRYGASSNLEY
jgi:hypothetical protein